ncbi:hypothetical protein EV188_10486 [Actinomycetospora succinea]|uniref:Uncharacterized protein n=1 Tax=Actinomycetospora succinea TaxID=663603 RepID=A0A4R6V938_9PSEU|nr:hypothetical protein [Actinomycetospora succinea]TDQ58347.1 hypothetical protein EV188_10486 [Actinomycetospora succinea]
MSFLRRRADAPVVAEPGRTPDMPAEDAVEDAGPPRRLTRSERKALKAEQAAAAELAARVARAQRRLAQATGPLPVVPQRRSSENVVPTE